MASNLPLRLLRARNSLGIASARREETNAFVPFPCTKEPKLIMVVYLIAAALLFAIGQIFQYVISTHICNGTSGKIDGALFETLFTLLAVVMTWAYWSSITEDDWPMPGSGTSNYDP